LHSTRNESGRLVSSGLSPRAVTAELWRVNLRAAVSWVQPPSNLRWQSNLKGYETQLLLPGLQSSGGRVACHDARLSTTVDHAMYQQPCSLDDAGLATASFDVSRLYSIDFAALITHLTESGCGELGLGLATLFTDRIDPTTSRALAAVGRADARRWLYAPGQRSSQICSQLCREFAPSCLPWQEAEHLQRIESAMEQAAVLVHRLRATETTVRACDDYRSRLCVELYFRQPHFRDLLAGTKSIDLRVWRGLHTLVETGWLLYCRLNASSPGYWFEVQEVFRFASSHAAARAFNQRLLPGHDVDGSTDVELEHLFFALNTSAAALVDSRNRRAKIAQWLSHIGVHCGVVCWRVKRLPLEALTPSTRLNFVDKARHEAHVSSRRPLQSTLTAHVLFRMLCERLDRRQRSSHRHYMKPPPSEQTPPAPPPLPQSSDSDDDSSSVDSSGFTSGSTAESEGEGAGSVPATSRSASPTDTPRVTPTRAGRSPTRRAVQTNAGVTSTGESPSSVRTPDQACGLTAASLAGLTEDEMRARISAPLYSRVSLLASSQLAGKVTGCLLERDVGDILDLLDSQPALGRAVSAVEATLTARGLEEDARAAAFAASADTSGPPDVVASSADTPALTVSIYRLEDKESSPVAHDSSLARRTSVSFSQGPVVTLLVAFTRDFVRVMYDALQAVGHGSHLTHRIRTLSSRALLHTQLFQQAVDRPYEQVAANMVFRTFTVEPLTPPADDGVETLVVTTAEATEHETVTQPSATVATDTTNRDLTEVTPPNGAVRTASAGGGESFDPPPLSTTLPSSHDPAGQTGELATSS
ncbi:hypothetical protein OAO87_01745, partial [bacterium]|nr:hypothetical protein [bacterium]